MHNAWLRTVEDGIHTYDIFKEGVSKAEAEELKAKILVAGGTVELK